MDRNHKYFRVLAVLSGLAITLLLFGADTPQTKTPQQNDDDVDYVPPAKKAPGGRKGGIARGCKEDPELYVSILAPRDGAGRTTQAQPVLFWSISKPTKHPIEIAINIPKDPKPVFDLQLKDGIESAGLQRLDLSKQPGSDGHEAQLQPGIKYDWVVEVVMHQVGGSNNPIATAQVERVELSADQAAELDKLPGSGRASFFGKSQHWYDMLDELDKHMRAEPENSSARNAWARVLKSQGLVQSGDGRIDEPAPPKQ